MTVFQVQKLFSQHLDSEVGSSSPGFNSCHTTAGFAVGTLGDSQYGCQCAKALRIRVSLSHRLRVRVNLKAKSPGLRTEGFSNSSRLHLGSKVTVGQGPLGSLGWLAGLPRDQVSLSRSASVTPSRYPPSQACTNLVRLGLSVTLCQYGLSICQ